MNNTSFELVLDDMAYGGDAIGHHHGRAVFVPGGITGERVRVRLQQSGNRLLRGRIVEVLEPSPHRVTPPCPFFGMCGGCHWQHIAYDHQLELKSDIVRSQLERLGGQENPPVRTTLGMENPWGYRNHVQLKIDAAGHVGYYAPRSNNVVPVNRCLLTDPLLDEIWDALDLGETDLSGLGLTGIALRAGIHTEQQMLIFEGNEPEPPAIELDMPLSCLYQSGQDEIYILAGNSHYHEELLGRRYQVSGPAFFQVNTLQAERLIQVMREMLAIQPEETLLDAYCGGGALGLSLASQCAYVIGIETSPWSLRDAEINALEENVTLIEGAVEDVLPELDEPLDAVVLDPPRAGCAPAVVEALAQAAPSRIVYVSCDPATLSRDVKSLCQRGYRLDSVQPVDMFPQTYHIETVSKLVRN